MDKHYKEQRKKGHKKESRMMDKRYKEKQTKTIKNRE